MTGLKEQLEKHFGRGFDYEYIRRLTGKIRNQLTADLDRTKIEERMAFSRENYRMMREELLKIVYWRPDNTNDMPRPAAKDRVEAAKSVVMLDLALLNAEIANGLYKKPLEEIAKQVHYEPLPADIRTVVIAAWARGGLLPKGVVEEMVPAENVKNWGGISGQTH